MVDVVLAVAKFKEVVIGYLKVIKYLFGPANIIEGKRIYLRKRWLHNGYQLMSGVLHPTDIGEGMVYEHIVYLHSLRHAEVYLKNQYNVTVEL